MKLSVLQQKHLTCVSTVTPFQKATQLSVKFSVIKWNSHFIIECSDTCSQNHSSGSVDDLLAFGVMQ